MLRNHLCLCLISLLGTACSAKERAPLFGSGDQGGGGGGGVGYATTEGGGGGVDVGTSATGAATGTALNVDATAIEYDASTGRLYYTTAPGAASSPNSLFALDGNGKTLWSVMVGSDPHDIAVSDNGAAIYVALAGAGKVIRVSKDGKVEGEFPLGVDEALSEVLYAADLEVLPGTVDSVLVATSGGSITGYSRGGYVYDDGTLRKPATAPAYDYRFNNFDEVEVISQTLALGYNNSDTGFNLYSLVIDSAGVSVKKDSEDLVSGFGTQIRYHPSGHLYSSRGEIVDINGPALIGRFEIPDVGSPVLPTEGGAYYLEDLDLSDSNGSGHAARLLRYSVSNFAVAGTRTIFGAQNSFEFKDIKRWGKTGVAVLEATRIILVKDAFE